VAQTGGAEQGNGAQPPDDSHVDGSGTGPTIEELQAQIAELKAQQAEPPARVFAPEVPEDAESAAKEIASLKAQLAQYRKGNVEDESLPSQKDFSEQERRELKRPVLCREGWLTTLPPLEMPANQRGYR
jgi:ribosomal protein L29